MQMPRQESSIIIFGENLLRPERVTGKKRPEAGSQQRHSAQPLVGKAEIQHSTEQPETHERGEAEPRHLIPAGVRLRYPGGGGAPTWKRRGCESHN